jgi:hypothetical protein
VNSPDFARKLAGRLILFLHLFKQLVETIMRIIDAPFHARLDHPIPVRHRLENRLKRYPGPVADLIRDTFKRGKYQDVILPLTVLRRIDCVVAPTKKQVLEKHAQFKDKRDSRTTILTQRGEGAEGFYFY